MEIAALILGTYVISAGLIYSDGAWGIIYNLRSNKIIKDFGVLECFLCTSFYVSIALTALLGIHWLYIFIGWGASVLIDKLISIYMLRG